MISRADVHSPITEKSENARYLLGVDGGGTKTVAVVARLNRAGGVQILGTGKGGPSNLRLAGKQESLDSLDTAIDVALHAAGLEHVSLDCAVLALAGSTSPDVQEDVAAWANRRKLAIQVEIVHDALPVLAQGTTDGWGITLIVGTGSVAVGVERSGRSVTKGGWGHWFGDKGSGFYLGYKALSAVAEASDAIGPETLLSELVLETLGTQNPRNILEEVSSSGDTRRAVAALAPVVFDAAGKRDEVAIRIVKSAVEEAVKLVAAVTKTLSFEKSYELAVAGSVVCRNQLFRDELLISLNHLEYPPGKVTLVDEPVLGCLKIAEKTILDADSSRITGV